MTPYGSWGTVSVPECRVGHFHLFVLSSTSLLVLVLTHLDQVHLPWSKSNQGSQASHKSGGSSRRWKELSDQQHHSVQQSSMIKISNFQVKV